MAGKILHLIGQMGRGGAERQLLYLGHALHARGWPQAVVSFDRDGPWKDRWNDIHLPFYEIPRRAFKPWRLCQLARIFAREQPAIIQCWSPHVAQYARWAWGKGRAQLLYGMRCNETLDCNTGEALQQIPYLHSITGAACVVSNSQGALDSLTRRGAALPSSRVIQNIVPLDATAQPGKPAAIPRIMASGSLLPRKGYDGLLRAAAILADEGTPFSLLFAGEGPERARLEALVAGFGLTARVRFLGARDDVPQLLADAHIFAHPSKSEGLSNSILEAMAAGLPVVSTTQCAAEIITDGQTGLLTPFNQPAELAAALRRLLGDPGLRQELGAAARNHVAAVCNVDTITAQYEQVYHALLTGMPVTATCDRAACVL